jgi:CelD/BcsL family acetyltransferase involved in cellulose biosynthesis
VHLLKLIGWIIDRDGATLDLLLGAEEYKADWTDAEAQQVVGFVVRRFAPASAARLGVGKIFRELRWAV